MQHQPALTIADTEALLDQVRATRPDATIWAETIAATERLLDQAREARPDAMVWTEPTGRGVAYRAEPKGGGSWSVMSGSLEQFLIWLRDC